MIAGDGRVLWAMIRGPGNGGSHPDRLQSLYAGQAEHYDAFRERYLRGRRILTLMLPLEPGARLVEMGAGTGWNLEALGDRIRSLSSVTLVDLCPALLDVARNRCRLGGWSNVRVVQGDAVTWTPPDREPVDVVLFSYSLTMIPEWSRAIDNALGMLRPGGSIGIVDFMVSRRQPALLRAFWGAWFGHNDVHPSLDHIPFLVSRTRTTHLSDHPLPVPYLPFLRARYYLFVGRKETARPAGIPPPHTILTSPQCILNEDRLYPQQLEKRRQRTSP